jgi:hypothetical protein
MVAATVNRHARKVQDRVSPCPWCGGVVVVRVRNGGRLDCVCEKCESGRDWLRQCAIHSDRPINYLMSRQKEFAKLRAESASAESAVAAPVEAPRPDTSRRDDLLRVLTALVDRALAGCGSNG